MLAAGLAAELLLLADGGCSVTARRFSLKLAAMDRHVNGDTDPEP